MKNLSLYLSAALLFQSTAVTGAEQCVMLGDSLTFAYEAEFGFEVTVPFGDTYGDGFEPEVRNWAEILNDTAYRNNWFDLGARDEIEFAFFYDLLFRHQYNWALPGLKVKELREFITRKTSFSQMIQAGDPILQLLVLFSDLNQSEDFKVVDLEAQIQFSAERLVFFIGGNDIKSVYGGIYDGNPPGAFVADFISDASVILDRVLLLNPNIQIVVVNVPHVGITPDVKATWPTDPVKTERVTAVLRDLNGQLAGLAKNRGLGYADIFTPTLSLLAPGPLCIQGVPFANTGSTSGDLNYVWLNGAYSANFHPNTNAQALIANEIIDAFNSRYGTGIAPLTATETLYGLLEKPTTEIDMPFATWMTCFGLPGHAESDDTDGDGIPAAVEFALGLNPILRDGHKLSSAMVSHAGNPALALVYPIRLPASAHYSLAPASSPDLSTPFVRFAIVPVPETDGLARAVLPLTGGTGFLRLESTITP